MEQKGVENPERFLQNINLIDPQVQQVLLQNPAIAPVIQEMQRRVQMAKQGQQLPDDEGGEQPMPEQQPANENPEQDFTERLSHLKGRHLLNG